MTENILTITTVLIGAVAIWALLWLILGALALAFRDIARQISAELQHRGWSPMSANLCSMLPFSVAAATTVGLLFLATDWSLKTFYSSGDHASLPNMDTVLLVSHAVIIVGMLLFFTMHVFAHVRDSHNPCKY